MTTFGRARGAGASHRLLLPFLLRLLPPLLPFLQQHRVITTTRIFGVVNDDNGDGDDSGEFTTTTTTTTTTTATAASQQVPSNLVSNGKSRCQVVVVTKQHWSESDTNLTELRQKASRLVDFDDFEIRPLHGWDWRGICMRHKSIESSGPLSNPNWKKIIRSTFLAWYIQHWWMSSLERRKRVMPAFSLETADREENVPRKQKRRRMQCVWNMIDGRRRRRRGEKQPILVVILYYTVPQCGKLWEWNYWDPLHLLWRRTSEHNPEIEKKRTHRAYCVCQSDLLSELVLYCLVACLVRMKRKVVVKKKRRTTTTNNNIDDSDDKKETKITEGTGIWQEKQQHPSELFFTVRKRELEVWDLFSVRNQDSDHYWNVWLVRLPVLVVLQLLLLLQLPHYHWSNGIFVYWRGRLLLCRNYFNEGTFQQEQQQPSSLPSKEDRTLTKIKQKTKRDSWLIYRNDCLSCVWWIWCVHPFVRKAAAQHSTWTATVTVTARAVATTTMVVLFTVLVFCVFHRDDMGQSPPQ